MQELPQSTGRVGIATPNYTEWGAVWAGAISALAVSFVLLAFGAAVGLSAVSPWSVTSSSLTAVGLGSAFWILLVSLWSFALAGYLSARLRHRWSDTADDEVEFRDKAHGLLAWATAVTVAAIVASGIGAPSRTAAGQDNGITASAVDRIVRTTNPDVAPADAALRGEVARTLAANLTNPSLSGADRAFLVGLAQSRGGLNAEEATSRVAAAFVEMKTATNRARKAGIIMGFLVAATLLVGAATSWWAAGVGGGHRDQGTVWQVFARHSPWPGTAITRNK
ncbi:MAG: hypothetical protein R3D27_05810 [Hyphomicrobiaceae bacterium]